MRSFFKVLSLESFALHFVWVKKIMHSNWWYHVCHQWMSIWYIQPSAASVILFPFFVLSFFWHNLIIVFVFMFINPYFVTVVSISFRTWIEILMPFNVKLDKLALAFSLFFYLFHFQWYLHLNNEFLSILLARTNQK